MQTQGPFTLTLGTPLAVSDPGATSNNPATAVQIQNASPFVIDVNLYGAVLTIQSFTAQTISIDSNGQQGSITPIPAGATAQTFAAASLTLVWLLAGESAPMNDGPLTAAAISTSLAQSGLSGATVIGYSHTLAAGASITPTLSGSAPFRLWNWGFAFAVTAPSTGGCTLILGPVGTPVTDSVWVGSPASNRLAGLVFSTAVTIINDTDQEVSVFIDYSNT